MSDLINDYGVFCAAVSLQLALFAHSRFLENGFFHLRKGELCIHLEFLWHCRIFYPTMSWSRNISSLRFRTHKCWSDCRDKWYTVLHFLPQVGLSSFSNHLLHKHMHFLCSSENFNCLCCSPPHKQNSFIVENATYESRRGATTKNTTFLEQVFFFHGDCTSVLPPHQRL